MLRRRLKCTNFVEATRRNMDEKMEIAIVQHDIVAESVERTLSGIESLLAGVEAVDLVVLPEMFATGFDVDDASVAEPPATLIEVSLTLASCFFVLAISGVKATNPFIVPKYNRLFWGE